MYVYYIASTGLSKKKNWKIKIELQLCLEKINFIIVVHIQIKNFLKLLV